MKKNSMKIKQGALAVVGLVILGGFGMAFGDYHTVMNSTPYKIHVTMDNAACPDSDFYIEPNSTRNSTHKSGYTMCAVNKVEATVLPPPTNAPNTPVWMRAVKQTVAAITAAPYLSPANRPVWGDITWQVVGPDNQGKYQVIKK